MSEINHRVTATFTEQPSIHDLVQLYEGDQIPPDAKVSVFPRVGPDRGDPQRWIVEMEW